MIHNQPNLRKSVLQFSSYLLLVPNALASHAPALLLLLFFVFVAKRERPFSDRRERPLVQGAAGHGPRH